MIVARPDDIALVGTYRVQLRAGLTLDDLAKDEWLSTLADLGISHLYLSPPFEASEGSSHGYDVVDHRRVDPCIGGDAAFERLAEAAHARGLGIIVDLVPNHMAVGVANPWWWDLLRNGMSSASASLFDLDWEVPEKRLHGRILLPVLADHLGREIEAGNFVGDVTDDGEVLLRHEAIVVPLELSSIATIIADVADDLSDSYLAELSVRAAALPLHDDERLSARAQRTVDEQQLRGELSETFRSREGAARMRIRLRAEISDPSRLDALLELQPYRLARWRAGLEDLGYRRFFDVTSLIALASERPGVFDVTHSLVRHWVAEGLIDGVRVDHVDGLADPQDHLDRLRSLVGDRPIWVEKILEGNETLPRNWAVEGTTGYECAELIGRLDIDDRGRAPMEHIAELVGAPTDVHDTEVETMALVVRQLLAPDLHRVTDLLLQACEEHRRVRDTTRHEISELIVDIVSHFRRYRTYVLPGHQITDDDAELLDRIFEQLPLERDAANSNGPSHDPDLVYFVRQIFRGEVSSRLPAKISRRLQQLTGPARAKGCEDTAWYRLVALLSRCEVGSDPFQWGIELEDFHARMTQRHEDTPLGLTALSTHDSKRSSDVRLRLDVASQWADDYVDIVERWLRRAGSGPDPTMDPLIIQTLIGVPEIDTDRLQNYLVKASREAKVMTSWLDPHPEHEAELRAHATRMLVDPELAADIRAFSDLISVTSRNAMLARTLLHLTLPGVPDIYQGTEAPMFALVDPDNRARVDPLRTQSVLISLATVSTALPIGPDHVAAKTALTRLGLTVRRRHLGAFGPAGNYVPKWATGSRSDHVVAFGRGSDVIVVVPRLGRRLLDGWNGTRLDLSDGTWADRCGGQQWSGTVELDDLLSGWPVALLEREPDS